MASEDGESPTVDSTESPQCEDPNTATSVVAEENTEENSTEEPAALQSTAHRIEQETIEGPRFSELLSSFHVDQWDGTLLHASVEPAVDGNGAQRQQPAKKKKKKKKKKKQLQSVQPQEAAGEGEGADADGEDAAAAAAAHARSERVERLEEQPDEGAAAAEDPEPPAPAEAAAAATLVATSAAAAAVDCSVAAAAAEPEVEAEAGAESDALAVVPDDLSAEEMSEAVLTGGEWAERSETVNDEIKAMWETCATSQRRQMRTHRDIADRFHSFADIVLKIRRYHRQLHDSLVCQLEATQANGGPVSCVPATSAMERFRWREHHCELALWHATNALKQGLERACCQLCTATTDAMANLLLAPSAAAGTICDSEACAVQVPVLAVLAVLSMPAMLAVLAVLAVLAMLAMLAMLAVQHQCKLEVWLL